MSETSEKIELKNVRLSFAELWQAKAFQEGQAPKYQASFLLDPSDKDHKKMIKTVKAEADRIKKAQWGDKPPKLKGECFGDGDDLDTVYDGYEGMFFMRANKNAADGRVTIVNSDNSPLTVDDGKPYNGCYVDATLTLWTQDNSFGKRINGNLRAIRFRGDGEAFGRPAIEADDEFSEAPEDGADDDGFLDD